MNKRSVVGFLAGFVALTPLVGSAIIAVPRTAEGAQPVDHATLWKNGAVSHVALPAPIVEPEFIRDDDDTLWIAGNASPDLAQRFDPKTMRVDPPAQHQKLSLPSPPMPDGVKSYRLAEGDAHLYLAFSEHAGDPHRTFFRRGDAWIPGPSLAPDASPGDARALVLPSQRVALLSSSMDGPSLYVASVGDAEFRAVPVRGPSWSGLTVASGIAADAGNILVFTWSYAPSVSSFVIDASSGAVMPGPAFGRPKDASGIYSVRGEWLPGGGMLLVENGNRMRSDGPVRSAIAAGILVALLALLTFGLVKRWFRPLALVVGLVVGVIPLAIIALSIAASGLAHL